MFMVGSIWLPPSMLLKPSTTMTQSKKFERAINGQSAAARLAVPISEVAGRQVANVDTTGAGGYTPPHGGRHEDRKNDLYVIAQTR
jgi:hypothetical protein